MGWAEGVHREDFANLPGHYYVSAFDRRPETFEWSTRPSDVMTETYRWVPRLGQAEIQLRRAPFAGYIGSCIDVTQRKGRRRKALSSVSPQTN